MRTLNNIFQNKTFIVTPTNAEDVITRVRNRAHFNDILAKRPCVRACAHACVSLIDNINIVVRLHNIECCCFVHIGARLQYLIMCYLLIEF